MGAKDPHALTEVAGSTHGTVMVCRKRSSSEVRDMAKAKPSSVSVVSAEEHSHPPDSLLGLTSLLCPFSQHNNGSIVPQLLRSRPSMK